MKRGIGFLLSLAMLLAALGPIGAGAAVAKAAEGDLPESYYVQPPVGTCASCGAPLFAREGNWAEDQRCYDCWANDRNKWSIVLWTPPRPHCAHCGNSTLGNTSGLCDGCVMAGCGEHTQTVAVVDKATGKPVEGAMVTGGALGPAQTDASGKASKSEPHMHLDGTADVLVSCDGYQSQKLSVAVRELAETLTVELETLPEAFTIPLDLSSFVGEAYGPVLLNAEWQLEPLPFPIKVDHLLSNEVTLTRDPETGEYKGSFQLNGLAELLFQGKAAVEGEVTARWDEEQARLELVNSDVTASVTLSQDLSYLFLGVDGELTPQIRLTGAYQEDGSLHLVPAVSCSGSAYAYLGKKLEQEVLAGKVKLKLGAELTGGVNFTMQADLANGENVLQDFVQLGGNLRAVAKLLGFERTWEGYYWQYYPVVSEEDGPAYEPPQPVDRFPGRSETGTAGEDSQQFRPDAAPAFPTEEGDPVVENAGDHADPVLVPLGNGSVSSGTSGKYNGAAALFWVEDATERTEINRYRLVYSLYDGLQWGDPTPVYDDGTADFAPRAVTVNGEVYLLWQSANQEFPGMVNSSEYARSMDLYAAVLRDGQMQDVTNLTEETGGYCGMHNLEVVDGNVTAGWLANDSGDLLFAEGQNHRYEAVYEQGAWKVQREDAVAEASAPGMQALELMVPLGQADAAESVEAAGTKFYCREDGSIACERQGEELILAPDAQTSSFETVTNGELVFLYWLHAGEEGAFRLDGAFYHPGTGKCSAAQTYLGHGNALHGIDASMDGGGNVLMAYQSSDWSGTQRRSYASSDLMTAVIAPPQDMADGGVPWVLPAVSGSVLVLAVVGAVIFLMLRNHRQRKG